MEGEEWREEWGEEERRTGGEEKRGDEREERVGRVQLSSEQDDQLDEERGG